jgi:hypothetical protein
MSTQTQPSPAGTAFPRILGYCRCCELETPHEIHTADGMSITLCVRCLERAVLYEMDRD